MKTTNGNKSKGFIKGAFIVLISFVMLNIACNRIITPIGDSKYQVVNLVADTAGYYAAMIDVNLKNAWGIAISPSGKIWISANHSGSTVIYDYNGNTLLAPVNIPIGANPNGASPTGVVFNSTTGFVIPGKGKGAFIFATEDGILSAWNSSLGASTMTVADNSSSGTVYKGLALAKDGGLNYLYATDFHNGKIDVFDSTFAMVMSKHFMDPGIPAGFAPFGIKNIGGLLYVTYAKQLAPDNKDDEKGVGNGFIDIYTPAGTLVKRFASGGMLNSPWGIAQAPAGFEQGKDAILIGNFGDGYINVFNEHGNPKGQLMESTGKVKIDGLWDLTFDKVTPANSNNLYFTAGPAEESHGLFGYVKLQ